ncbi:MAG: Hsp20/alpha crystallin family protein [Acidobacteriia bacterium]|nr:Hsp20/alpha crystallin family protein [Methyloceanibacter sp.]MBX5471525.1 Hsp20/alpha crystallin family protein [Acetobacteraceae bacterium]MCL6491544.1 Hsp20/alpha crystallin family protein [Terriglobia bacterium]
MTRNKLDAWFWTEACSFIERAERLHRSFFQPLHEDEVEIGWAPPVDVFESDEDLLIIVALPGVAPADIRAELNGDVLTIFGRRSLPDLPNGAYVHRMEIPHGRFLRRLRMPSPHMALKERGIENGCLILRLAKRY